MGRPRVIDTRALRHDDFVSTFDTTTQPEAASAVSEFGHEQHAARRTHPTRLSLWSRILRALRARRTPKGPKL